MKDINKEISDFIDTFKNTLLEKCGNIIGIYLFGSLTYGGFDEKSSDIDLVVITKTLLNKTELEEIKNIHRKLNEENTKWAKRLEVSYTPVDMLSEKTSPTVPRPYYNEIFYDEATYGNEWLINNYLLINYGKVIYGQDFKTLIKNTITINDVTGACKYNEPETHYFQSVFSRRRRNSLGEIPSVFLKTLLK